ncbi:MAG: biopolymer transporter ExbD [Ignavibacteriae bacterium]|nr:biopolymer transporter ExbD [Ignavibacteriota bacterium]MCB9244154.1 biopolymer transporter ExbD [Ignavibacteriales bacterium]
MKKSRSTKKPGINIDMTPLVDVIMLLLTFFMLTATFKAAESEIVEVTLPKSVNTDSTRLPDQDIMTLTLTPKGDIWLDVDSYEVRKEVFGDAFGIGLFHPDSTSKSEFEETGKVGDQMLKRTVIKLDKAGFEKVMNDLRLQLKNNSDNTRDYKIVVKGDKDTNYGLVEDLMTSLKDSRNTRFALVTDLKLEE